MTTRKEELANRLNVLKIAAGEKPMSEKWYKGTKTWTMEALIAQYEAEANRADDIDLGEWVPTGETLDEVIARDLACKR